VGWALDSGGFSELSMYGKWQTTEAQYIHAVYKYQNSIGLLDWAAPQDWMCEPWMVRETGLSVREHQHRTVENYCRLRSLAPTLPFIPVLQGWTLWDYLVCIQLYEDAGVKLTGTVGLGSVCRRQSSTEIAKIVSTLHDYGLRLHGFGVKTQGLGIYGPMLESADSMAWSFAGRRDPPLPGCLHSNCANCYKYALKWRRRVLSSLLNSG
jgi:hypothetical protein